MKRWTWIQVACVALIAAAAVAEPAKPSRGKLEFEAWIEGDDTGFAPNHIAAVWLEDEHGDFVTTILLRGYRQTKWLSTWKAAAKRPAPDAVTGATLTKFGKIEAEWDGRTPDGKLVPDGVYVLRAETIWWNGNGYEIEGIRFEKGPKPSKPDAPDKNNFKDIFIQWTPSAKTAK